MESIQNQSETSAAEIAKLRELVEGEPQAFFILVGAMKYSEQKGRYESGAFGDPDENSKLSTGVPLATGGKDRMLAAAELHKAFPNAAIVAMSKTRDEAKPTYAKATAEELENKGVNPEVIIKEEESVSTITEYKETAKLWQQNRWSEIAFITSNWHLPRTQALFDHIQSFADTEEEEALLKEFTDAITAGKLKV